MKEEETIIPKKQIRLREAKYLDSCNLFQGDKEIVIIHGDIEYRLRQTSQGKLILTK